jgi:hypothetical protein
MPKLPSKCSLHRIVAHRRELLHGLQIFFHYGALTAGSAEGLV